MRHVLSSQIHRRFNRDRAITTTQRRLKRLADAGLLERFQLHRRDGGGAPMCCSIASPGLALLRAHGRLPANGQTEGASRRERPASTSKAPLPVAGERRLLQARRDVHLAGWVLALECSLGPDMLSLRGAEESALSPPLRSTSAGRMAIGPQELRLPGGRTPHDFLRTDSHGQRAEVERFETVRPDASIEVGGLELLIEADDRLPLRRGRREARERYDTPRWRAGRWASPATRGAALRVRSSYSCVATAPVRASARAAPTACWWRVVPTPGSTPHDWGVPPGGEAILYAAERDVHEGSLLAYGVQRLPPEVRGSRPAGGGGGCERSRARKVAREIPLGATRVRP